MEFKVKVSLKERNVINFLRKHGFVIFSVGHKVTQDDCVYGYIEFISKDDEKTLIHYDCDTEILYTAGQLSVEVQDWVYWMNKNKGGK